MYSALIALSKSSARDNALVATVDVSTLSPCVVLCLVVYLYEPLLYFFILTLSIPPNHFVDAQH